MNISHDYTLPNINESDVTEDIEYTYKFFASKDHVTAKYELTASTDYF